MTVAEVGWWERISRAQMNGQGLHMDEYSFGAWLGHILSPIAIVGTAIGYFPVVAAFAAFIWYMIQIWESPTMQTWLHTRRLQKMARLQLELERLTAAEKTGAARKDQKAS